MPLVPQTQSEYFRRNTVKPADVETWFTVEMSHPDFTTTPRYVAIEPDRGVEYDESIYTFEGVLYKPVSMTYVKNNESASTPGRVSLRFARAGTEIKRRRREITIQNRRVPISCILRQYQTGLELPVWRFSGNIAFDYPKISGQDAEIVISQYNPSLLTVAPEFITTVDRFPELRDG